MPPRRNSFAIDSFTEMLNSNRQQLSPDDNNITNESLDDIMKKRHLNQDERRFLHKPKSDWESTVRGDICKSANTLTVDDIILNYI